MEILVSGLGRFCVKEKAPGEVEILIQGKFGTTGEKSSDDLMFWEVKGQDK